MKSEAGIVFFDEVVARGPNILAFDGGASRLSGFLDEKTKKRLFGAATDDAAAHHPQKNIQNRVVLFTDNHRNNAVIVELVGKPQGEGFEAAVRLHSLHFEVCKSPGRQIELV